MEGEGLAPMWWDESMRSGALLGGGFPSFRVADEPELDEAWLNNAFLRGPEVEGGLGDVGLPNRVEPGTSGGRWSFSDESWLGLLDFGK